MMKLLDRQCVVPRVRFRIEFKVHSIIVPTCAINLLVFMSRISSWLSLSSFSFSFSVSLSFRILCTSATKIVNVRNIVGTRIMLAHGAFLFQLIIQLILKNDPCANDSEENLLTRYLSREILQSSKFPKASESLTTTVTVFLFFFLIFDEYHRDERGMESFHRRFSRAVFRPCHVTSGCATLPACWTNSDFYGNANVQSKPAITQRHFRKASSFDVILWR